VTTEAVPLPKLRAQHLVNQAQGLAEKKDRSAEENDKLKKDLGEARNCRFSRTSTGGFSRIFVMSVRHACDDFDAHAAVLLVLADQADRERGEVEVDAVVDHVVCKHLREDLTHVFDARVFEPKQVDIAGCSVGFARPEREERGTFEHELLCMSRCGEAEQQAFVRVPSEHHLEVLAPPLSRDPSSPPSQSQWCRISDAFGSAHASGAAVTDRTHTKKVRCRPITLATDGMRWRWLEAAEAGRWKTAVVMWCWPGGFRRRWYGSGSRVTSAGTPGPKGADGQPAQCPVPLPGLRRPQ
jgi:hypothetical protein